jgi:hypothetical protein
MNLGFVTRQTSIHCRPLRLLARSREFSNGTFWGELLRHQHCAKSMDNKPSSPSPSISQLNSKLEQMTSNCRRHARRTKGRYVSVARSYQNDTRPNTIARAHEARAHLRVGRGSSATLPYCRIWADPKGRGPPNRQRACAMT